MPLRPKVSICIPTYNQPEFLTQALMSVSTQTYTDYEIIITDDSTDERCKDVITLFSQRGLPIQYNKNTHTLGSPENWNEAVRKSKGEYIKILHQDDLFLRDDALALFVQALDVHTNADFVFCSSTNMHDGKEVHTHIVTVKEISKLQRDPRALFPANFVGGPSATMYRKSINLEYDIRMKVAVDVDFYIRVLSKNPSFVYIKETLIGTESGSEHQLTNQLQHGRQAGLIEPLILYGKINQGIWFPLRTGKYILYILRLFKVHSFSDIPEITFTGPSKTVLGILFGLKKILPI